MKCIRIISAVLATLAISCITDPDGKDDDQKGNSILFQEGRILVYSIHEVNNIDSTASNDSSIGVMVIRVGRIDSIRHTEVHRWTVVTEYFTGSSHPTDSVFTSYDYVEETDSFLTNRAYPTKYERNSGILMKRMLCEQTDSVSANGDSVQIENVEVRTFSKMPSVDLVWTLRPDWLEYEIVTEDAIQIGNESIDCFKIEATPLDSHCTVKNESSYRHESWITSDKILRTFISHPLPDSIWDIPNLTKIELIDEIENSQDIIMPSSYKADAMERGWN